MNRRTFFVDSYKAALGLSILPLAACSRGDQKAWEKAAANVDKQAPGLLESFKVPGLSLALIDEAKIVWSRSFGVKDRESNVPVDTGTIFEAASMSKPVFAYAVMNLCEKGVLDLDTALTKYTPDRIVKNDPRLDLITARHVLSHTSGFQNWREEGNQPLSIHFTPGEKWLYSGEGYSYLQSVVTRLTGEPIEPFMKSNVLEPFGMDSSGYIWNDMFERRMARPHDRHGMAMSNKKSTAESVARYASAGDLKSTPTDYAKFLIEVIAPKEADAFRLNRHSLEEMVRPHVAVPNELKLSVSWGLGWEIFHSNGADYIAHGGDNDGFHSYCMASMAKKRGYVAMTNGENGAELLQKLMVDVLNPFVVA